MFGSAYFGRNFFGQEAGRPGLFYSVILTDSISLIETLRIAFKWARIAKVTNVWTKVIKPRIQIKV